VLLLSWSSKRHACWVLKLMRSFLPPVLKRMHARIPWVVSQMVSWGAQFLSWQIEVHVVALLSLIYGHRYHLFPYTKMHWFDSRGYFALIWQRRGYFNWLQRSHFRSKTRIRSIVRVCTSARPRKWDKSGIVSARRRGKECKKVEKYSEFRCFSVTTAGEGV